MLSLVAAFLLLTVVTHKTEAVGFAPELYCGMENCYDVLEIDREQFDKANLPKIFRVFAKKYHPDRAKTKEEKAAAEQRFRVVGTAYETLRDDESRANYDYYLDHPEERFYNYYQYYRTRAAPKVDFRLVVIGTIAVISLFQYLSAKHKYAEAIDYALHVGKFRNMAITTGVAKGELEVDKNGKLKKVKGRDNEEVIKKIITENLDVTGGYKKESVRDTLGAYIIMFPYHAFFYLKWLANWVWRFKVKGEEYDEDAKIYLIRKQLGLSEDVFYHNYNDGDIDDMLANDVWKKEVFTKWKAEKDAEEQEKLAQSGKYKRYKRYMKNAGTISFVDDE